MRFLRSVALPKAAKLMLAATRSAVAMPAPISRWVYARPLGRALGFGLELALGLRLLRQQRERAARLLHRFAGALGGARHRDLDRGLELAVAQEADAVARVAEHARRHEGRRIDCIGLQLAGVDEGLDLADVH